MWIIFFRLKLNREKYSQKQIVNQFDIFVYLFKFSLLS